MNNTTNGCISPVWIRTENLQYTYTDDITNEETTVLRGVDFEVRRGEYIAVIGHNGSGKSTLAKLLNRIIEPTEGKIYIDGLCVTDPERTDDELYAIRQKIGMVFQNPDNQLVATVVEEDCAFGPENLGLPSEEIRRRVDEALRTVGMQDYAKAEPANLSGGQKQRVAIAGILAMMPECIIFDESTAMLDPQGRKDILRTMDMLNRERGITILTITHHMDEAALASRIVVLDDGVIRMDGTPEEVFSQPALLREAGLDVPQSAALVHFLREKGLPLSGNVGSVEDCIETLAHAFLNKAEGENASHGEN